MGAQLEEIIRAVLNHPEIRKTSQAASEGLTLKVKITNLEMEVSLCTRQQTNQQGEQQP